MPHAFGNFIPPVTQPPPGKENLSSMEVGVRAGRYRSPNQWPTDDHIGAVTPSNPAPTVPDHPMGVARRLRFPRYGNDVVRPFDGSIGNTGEHLQFTPGASMPQGEMSPLPKVHRNTFRARPAQWDANQFVGTQSPPTPAAG